MKQISVIGLGKVGLPLAACAARTGVSVLGYDTDPARRALLEGHNPNQKEVLFEEGLSDALLAHAERLRPVASIEAAICGSAISFVIVPTPSEPDGSFSLSCLKEVFTEIGAALWRANEPHLVVLISTVSPGSVDGVLVPLLERLSGKACGAGFGFCYAPALISLGSVMSGFSEPDFALLGEVDRQGADALAEFYDEFLPSGTPVHRMSAQSVEIAKIALNNFLTFKIGFSNLVGQLCDRTPQADASDVLAALGQDSRIGSKFLRAGMGFGGPCLPRDTDALAAAFRTIGVRDALPLEIGKSNSWHAAKLATLAAGHTCAVVLGLGYKPLSPVTMASPSIDLCNILARSGITVHAFDQLSEHMDLRDLDDEVVVAPTLAAALEHAQIVFLTTDHETIDGLAHCLPADVRFVDIFGGFAEASGHDAIITFGRA